MKQNHYDIIIIGGGPAGMMAAGRAGALGAKVLLLEKNERLGKKLSITGGGRCNITNAEPDNRLFLENFPEAKAFLFSPMSQFNVESTFDFFESRGLSIVVEDLKRAFPKSQKAEDVCRVMEAYVKESGNVTVKCAAQVSSFIFEEGRLLGVRTAKGLFNGDKIILATGGLAAPQTGSTDDGVSMLERIGHTVIDPDPDLAPLRTEETWVHALSGTTLDDVKLSFIQDTKTAFKERGRLLFTHFGISGPMVINAAHRVKKLFKTGTVYVSVDLFPDDDIGSLDKKIVQEFETHKNKKLKTVLRLLLQKRMSESILRRLDEAIGDTPIHSVSREERRTLVELMKDLRFSVSGTMGFEWSIVADGGVIPKEVDFRSMQSRLFENLYLIGDVLNINRPSGGFSLQLCWTTGWVAGTHAAE